ncbi:MAG: NAD(P)H-quinone oxidoreductase [Myxococcales bacterium]|nr:NAD(P)H-quinone oxidoreductase [Myxococcales bacterium]
MQAIVIREFGGPENLELREVETPTPGERQVRLAVHATALNRADLLQRRGMYPPPKGESDVLGLECSGVVEALGDGVTKLKEGDRVMALLPGGGYAENALIHEDMAIPIPASMSFEEAAAIPEAFLTAQEALFGLGGLVPGQTVLVHAAAGGVGSAAVQLAHVGGGKVIGTAGSEEKLELVTRLGADLGVNYKTHDFAEEAKKFSPGGVNLVLDFIGGSYWEKHAQCLAIAGRCVVIGVLGGPMANVNLALLLMKRHQILGLVMRSRTLEDKIRITQEFIRTNLPHFSTGKLKPVLDEIFPLADAQKAHERMEQNANSGKIILRVR